VHHRPILYAEDEENDAFFLRRAFEKATVSHPLVVVSDGQEAIDYFSGGGRYVNRSEHPLPCLLLLDLNMPRKTGLEVLQWIRREPPIRTLPVIVLTSSLQDSDIHRAYIHGANAYLAKPSQPDDLVAVAHTVRDFWLNLNRTVQQYPDLSEASTQSELK
jgi:CheY-like chemotaxis protein